MSFRNARRQMTNQVIRNGRNQLKLQKLRDRVRASINSYMARHQARTEWWKRTFSMPMVGMQWLFAKASSLAHALLALMGLAPRTRLAPRRFDVIQKEKRGHKARDLKRSLFHEQFEERKLMAADIEFAAASFVMNEDGSGSVPSLVVQGNLLGTTDAERTVTFQIPSGNASASADYTLPLVFTIPQANYESLTTIALPFAVVDDNKVEGPEDLAINITGIGSSLVQADVDLNNITLSGTNVTITDNEFATISIAPLTTITEQGGTQTFSATLTTTPGATLASPVTALVNVVAGGTATAPADYATLGTPSVSFGVGAASGASVAINITPSNDTLLESQETVLVSLSTATGPVTLSTATATVAISDNEVGNLTITKTTDGIEQSPTPQNGKFTVSLGAVNNTSSPVTVNYSVTGSASQGPDFSIPGSVTIAVGSSDATIDVTVSDDANLEVTEFVTVSLLTPVSTGSVTIGTASIASLSITDVEPTTATISAISVAAATASEGNTVATPRWLVSLSNVNNTGAPITVNYSVLAGSTADDPADYNALPGFVTIANGQSTAQISLTVNEDTIVETDEVIVLQLNSTSHASVSASSTPATVTILDNDSATVSIAPQGGPSFVESVDPVFVVSLSRPSATGTVVTYTLGSGATPAATAGVDFVSPSGTVSFAPGAVNATITVDVSDDTLLESNEKLVVSLTGAISGDPAYSFGTSTATATITDNETAVATVSATDLSAFETGLDSASFTVALSKVNNSADPITVTYALGGDAANAVDYTSLTGLAVIPVGSSDVVVTVTPVDDITVEANETVTLTLGANSFGASLTNGSANSGTVTIFDNDSALVSVTTPLPVAQSEATTARNFTLNLTKPSSTPTVIAYTIGGSAASGSDFNALVGSVTVPAGVTSFDIPVTVINDTVVESSETVIITLTSISSGDPSIDIDNSNKVSSLTITDNDSITVSLFVTDSTVSEPSNNGQFMISLSGPVSETVTVNYTVSGTATNGTDYTSLTGIATIPAGGSTALLDIAVSPDTLVEGPEGVTISLSSFSTPSTISGISFGTTSGSLTISDDDIGVSVTANDPNASETSGNPGQFTVSLTQPAATNTVVFYSLSGNATNVADYASLTGSVTILASQTVATIDVSVSDDALLEVSEKVVLTLTSATGSNAFLNGSTVATVDIADNESATISIFSNDALGLEGTPSDNAQFVVDLGMVNSTGSNIVVNYSLSGDAISGSDYVANPLGSVTIADGQRSAIIAINVSNDITVEASESVIAVLTTANTTLAGVSTTPSTVVIDDNDSATVSISPTTDGSEGATVVNGQFTVTMSAPSSTDTVVFYSKSGSASEGSDYATLSGSVTILAGNTTALVTVAVSNDVTLEPTENVVLTLTSLGAHDPQISIVGTPSATISIADDDSATLSIFASDASASETTLSPGEFVVSLSNPSSTATTVTFSIGGSATNAVDYDSLTGTVVIPSGSVTAVIPVTVSDDLLLEGPEDIILAVTAVTGDSDISINAAPATVVISDNETATITITKIADATEDPISNGSFLVNLGAVNSSASNLLVTYSIADSADPGADYVSLAAGSTGVATIASGASTAVITIIPVQDAIVEGPELIELTLAGTNNVNVGVSPAPAVVTITDADTATVTITKTLDGAEGAVPTNGRFVVSMDKQSSTNTVVFYSVGTGFTPIATPSTSLSGNDYAALSGSVTIFAGQTNATIDVNVSEDALLEGSEQVRVTLTSLSTLTDPDITITTATASKNATVTISDDDTATITITAPTSVAETDTGTAVKTFTVALDKANNTLSPITLTLGSGGGATPATDYTGLPSTVTIATGASTATFSVTITGDTTVEANEVVAVSVTGSSNSAVTTPSSAASYTIVNDDFAAVTIGSTTVTGAEGGVSSPNFTVSLSKPSDSATTVTYTILSGTADASADITSAATGTVTLNAGQTVTTVSVAVSNDTLLESSENLSVSLTGISGTYTPSTISLGSPITQTLTITDNDTAVATVTPLGNLSELESVSTRMFQVALNTVNNTGSSITIGYGFTGSAGSPGDYSAVPASSVVIAPGGSLATITVTVTEDLLLESDESVIVTLNPTTNNPSVTGSSTAATLTIANNDSTTVTITANDSSSTEAGDAGQFKVSLGTVNNTLAPIVVNYSLTGSASASDYGSLPGSVTIGIGQSEAFIAVNPSDDALLESDEYVVATLLGTNNSAAVTVSSTPATVTIVDNDTATVSISPASTTLVEGNSGIFTIALNKVNNTNAPITVTYSSGGDATAPADYAALSGTAVIAVGSSDVQVNVSTSNDVTVEATESVTLTLGTTSNPSVTGSGSSTLFVTDNDSATVSVTSSGSVAEPGAGQFVVQLSNPSSTNTTVTIATSGDATSGSDYTALPTTVVIAAGQTVATVAVTVLNDVTLEDDEQVVVTLGSITGDSDISVGTPSAATLTITDTDTAALSVSVTSTTVTEAVGTFNFTVNLSNPSDTPTVVLYSLGGNATSGLDYTVGASSVTFAPGETNKQVTITVSNDLLLESSETVSLQVTAFSGDVDISIGSPASQTVTITDNDTATVTITASTPVAAEQGPVNGVFKVDLGTTNLTGNDITVTLGTPTGSATNGVDYTTLATTAVIANNSRSVFVTLTPSDDNLVESTEFVTLGLAGTNNPAVTVSGAAATVSITDNDTATVSISNGGNGIDPIGTVATATNGKFIVSLTKPSATPTTITYSVANLAGQATPGVDYTALSNTVTIAASATEATIDVNVINDVTLEDDELVVVTLANTGLPSNITLGTAAASVTILDQDQASITVSASVATVNEPVANLATDTRVFTVSLSNPADETTSIGYSLTGSASLGGDYTLASGLVVIAAGQQTANVTVTVAGDNLLESTETVVLTLNNLLNSGDVDITVGSPNSATLSIIDTDTATVSIAGNTNATEAGSNGLFIVTIDKVNNTTDPITVTYSVGSASQAVAADYASLTGIATIASGSSTGVIDVQASNDITVESPETLILTLSSATSNPSVTTNAGSGTISIIDNDSAVVSIEKTTDASEPSTNGKFTVKLSAPSSQVETIYYGASGSATPGADYSALSGSVTVAIGATTATIDVNVSDDSLLESAELVAVTLTSHSGDPDIALSTVSGDVNAAVTISDNETAEIQISAFDASAAEVASTLTPDNGQFVVNLGKINNTANPITVTYSVLGGTNAATSVDDYASLTGTVVIPVGQQVATIDVNGIVDDNTVEADELVRVGLTGSSGGSSVFVDPTVATVTIVDNDSATIKVVGTGATEGSPGKFVVSLTKVSSTPTTVTYTVTGGSALLGVDYSGLTTIGTTVIPQGSTDVTITMTTSDDTLFEGNETVQVSLTGAVVGDPQISISPTASEATSTVTISDNETPTVTVTIAPSTSAFPSSSASELESVATRRFIVNLGAVNNTSSAISLGHAFSGSASFGTDFTAPTSVVIAVGSSDATLTLSISDDALLESAETAIVTVNAASNSSIVTGAQNSITIRDNETATINLSANDSVASETTVDNGQFRVTLDKVNNTANDITVTFGVGGTASESVDYANLPRIAIIAVGDSVGNVNILPVDDTFVEPTEFVTVNLISLSIANPSITVSTTPATVTILDNDTSAITIAATTQASEPSSNGKFTVSMSKPSDSATTITYTVTGDASLGPDYTLSGTVGTVVIAASETQATIDVTVSDDTLLEADEKVILTLTGKTGNSGVTLGSTVAATVTITDNESATVTVQASDATAAERVNEHNPAWLGVTGLSGWSESPDVASDSVPAVVVNTTAGLVSGLPAGINSPAAGKMLIHAGPANQGKDQVVVRWTAPSAGTISTLSAQFSMLHTAPVQAFVIKNGVTLASGTTASPLTLSQTAINVAAGDTIDFVVSTKVLGYQATSTSFDASLSFAPSVGPAAIYNAGADLKASELASNFSNPNGRWSYGTSGTIGGVLSLFQNQPADVGVYRVQLSKASYSNTVIPFSLSGSAQPADYSLSPTGSVTIAAGQTEAFITLNVVDDLLLEGNQSVVLTLGSISSGDSDISVSSPTAATVTIVDNESATVSITKVADGAEPGTPGQFMVSLTSPNSSGAPITVNYTVGGDAASPADYAALSGSVTIADGQSTALINVTVSNDITVEANELVAVTLTGSDNAAVSASSTPATVTIVDNDSATLTLFASDPLASEPANDGQFMVSLSAPSSTATVVFYSIGGSAVGGTDYTSLTGSVTIAAGSLTETILIDVIDDDILDVDKTVILGISSVTGDAQITQVGPASSTVVISDEDVTTASITASTPTANESGVAGKFTVSLGKPSASPTVLSYSISGGASNGVDYTSLTGLVTIAAFATTADITISPLQDTIVEGTETVVLTLGSLVSGDVDITVPSQSATVNITDDDAVVAGRGMFYNGKFGGALDTSKQALLPGQTASFANYTGYINGITGLAVDLSGTVGTVSLADLEFATWDGIAVGGFAAITPTQLAAISVAQVPGPSGTTRIQITIVDGTFVNTWLRVKVKANTNTHLNSDDVFYYGSVVADVGVGNLASGEIRVNAVDTVDVRNNQSTAANSVPITNQRDIDKDGRVNALDTVLVRNNQQTAGIVKIFQAPL